MKAALIAIVLVVALEAPSVAAGRVEAPACTPQVGSVDVVATAAQRAAAAALAQPPITDKANGFAWPDTPLGVLRSGNAYLFFGSDGGRHAHQIYRGQAYGNGKYGSAVRATGTLDDPLGVSRMRTTAAPPIDVSIEPNADPHVNPHYAAYDYLGGGPVYRVPPGRPGAGNFLMVYHAEIPTPKTHSFYSILGLAASPDNGLSWTDLGEIIRVNQSYAPDLDGYDIGDPPLTVSPDGQFLYLYFRDWIANGTTHWGNSLTCFSVARVSLAALYAAAFASPTAHAAPFAKYFHGGWNQPGLGGLSTDLSPNEGASGELQVVYDSALSRYVMIIGAGVVIFFAQSGDGFHWTLPVILRDFRNLPDKPTTYAMPIGTGADPHSVGASFYVYYTRYPTTGGGWAAASVERLRISCAASASK